MVPFLAIVYAAVCWNVLHFLFEYYTLHPTDPELVYPARLPPHLNWKKINSLFVGLCCRARARTSAPPPHQVSAK